MSRRWVLPNRRGNNPSGVEVSNEDIYPHPIFDRYPGHREDSGRRPITVSDLFGRRQRRPLEYEDEEYEMVGMWSELSRAVQSIDDVIARMGDTIPRYALATASVIIWLAMVAILTFSPTSPFEKIVLATTIFHGVLLLILIHLAMLHAHGQ